MDFPQTHRTNTGRPVQVDRTDAGTVTFADGDVQLATLTWLGGGEWRLELPGDDQRTLHAARDDPPIAATIVQIDVHEDEDDDTSGVDD
ncbi:hypothetical protein [Capillimicrobium parvum]|uniref:Uncharacterized protein n=1 Tax=Capillimicrobium parvum TaxID=2884022 RepID=A0A9E6XX44_9ACTN|nr:hypothetical protein [Capillimicrobium parvum]UGS35678.1 hypothetical protein DSM104329_02073 [Capillimicrobium parvum]